MIIDARNFGDDIKLSDHISSTREKVRVLNMRPGQKLIVDVTLDGEYIQPDGAPRWMGAAGREGVHTAMLTFVGGDGFSVQFGEETEIVNSRGRGIVFSECHHFDAHDLWVRGARTAGISVHDCSRFKLFRPTTIDTGNYQDAKSEGPNWPGSIKFVQCSDYEVFRPISIDHMGNGITATESRGGKWHGSICIDVQDVSHYINASPFHSVWAGLHVGSSNAYVINSEEEFNGASEGSQLDNCMALDAKWGLGYWGNEGKTVFIDNATARHCTLIAAEPGIKVHPNANIANLDTDGTVTHTIGSVDPALIADMRAQAELLKIAIIRHAPLERINKLADNVRSLFEQVRRAKGPLYSVGQRLYIVADVVDIEKATKRIRAGASVGGLELKIVSVEDPHRRIESLANALQRIDTIIDGVVD